MLLRTGEGTFKLKSLEPVSAKICSPVPCNGYLRRAPLDHKRVELLRRWKPRLPIEPRPRSEKLPGPLRQRATKMTRTKLSKNPRTRKAHVKYVGITEKTLKKYRYAVARFFNWMQENGEEVVHLTHEPVERILGHSVKRMRSNSNGETRETKRLSQHVNTSH